jgi:hypothetical protein
MSNSTPSKNSQPSKNALTHGFYAADIVLPWENQQEFDDLLLAFQGEYCPDGVSEEAAVFDLASLHWKKRRLEAGLQQALQKQRDFDTRIDGWDVGAAAKAQSKAVQVGCALIQKHLEQYYKPDEAKADGQAVKDEAKVKSQVLRQAMEFHKLYALVKELNMVSTNFVVPSFRGVERLKLDQMEQAYQPHIMEKELKIQAELDRRIEKVLKRLVMAKEFKRLYPAKSVKANQIEATKLPAKSSHDSDGS